MRGYVHGTKQTISLLGTPGTNGVIYPPINSTVDLIGTSTASAPHVLIGTETLNSRTTNAKIWYMAVYDEALSDDEIAADALRLADSDDG